LSGVTETLTAEVTEPSVKVVASGEKAMEKSGDGGGGAAEEEPPPQAALPNAENRSAATGTP